MPLGAVSSEVITVDPVVVSPDMASKNASVKLRPRSANTNGRAAKNVIASQLRVVSTKAWRTENRSGGAIVVNRSVIPIKAVSPAEPANTCQSGCPTTRSATSGAHIAAARVVSRMPIM